MAAATNLIAAIDDFDKSVVVAIVRAVVAVAACGSRIHS